LAAVAVLLAGHLSWISVPGATAPTAAPTASSARRAEAASAATPISARVVFAASSSIGDSDHFPVKVMLNA
jgi:hypothetical protein